MSDQLAADLHNTLSTNLGLAMLIGWIIGGVFLVRLIFWWKSCSRLKTIGWIIFGLVIAFSHIALEEYINHRMLMRVYDERRGLDVKLRRIQENREFLNSIKIELGQSAPNFTVRTNVNRNTTLPVTGKINVLYFYDTESKFTLQQIRDLQSIRSKYDSNWLELIVIGVMFELSDIKEFMRQSEITIPYCGDPTGEHYALFSDSPVSLYTDRPPELRQLHYSPMTKVILLSSDGKLVFFARDLDAESIKPLIQYIDDEIGKLKHSLH